MRHFLSVFLSLWFLAGCAQDIAGIDPPSDLFFFPSGLRLSPSGRTLFVTNGNSDLRYNGSTLLALDADRLHLMAADPLAYTGCKVDPQAADEFLCGLDTELVVSAVRLGSYAGHMVVLPAPEGSMMAYRLMISVRADPSLTFVDVYEDGEGRVTCLDCGAGCDATWPRDCKRSHRLEKDDGLPTDPFRIMVHEELGYAVVTHLNSPYLTVVDFAIEPPVIAQVFNANMTRNYNGYVGSYEAVTGPDEWPTFYVSNSYSPELAWFRWQYSPENGLDLLLQAGSIYLQSPYGPFESGAELRGLAFSGDGKRLYAAVRYPPVVVTFDVSEDAQGRTRLTPVDTVEVSAQPALLQVHSDHLGLEQVFVTSFPEGEVLVLDPASGTWVQRIRVGTGPHEFLFPPVERFPGFYVVNFAEGTISLVSHDGPAWRRLGRFGKPRQIGKD